MDAVVPLQGFVILTIYQPRRRWYGRKKSLMTIESAVPLPEGKAELRHTLLQGWIHPQPSYFEHRIPATILEHAP